MAGGFGTRLRSLVSNVPKPLAPVEGRPFLAYLIRHWVEQGVTDFIFLLHYEAKKINDVLNEIKSYSSFSKISIKIVVESEPLGTGGAILNAINVLSIKEEFMVANADTWLGSGIKEIAAMKSPALAAVEVPNTHRFGAIRFKGQKVCEYTEKNDLVGSGYINSGLYHLTPEVFTKFEIGSNFSIERDVFPNLVCKHQLNVTLVNDSFFDIGTPEDYLRFCKWIKLGTKNEI